MNTDFNSTDDNSAFLTEDGKEATIYLGSLFSNVFSNISPLYRSEASPTQIMTATRYGKRFILKGLKKEYADDPIFRLAMAKEFEIGFSLEHPSIRRTLSLEKVEGLGDAIVLEYIDGSTLSSLIKEGKLTVERGREICRDIAAGVDYLHGKQILHRDLKPSNILITHKGGGVKIIDFNLSDSDSFIILKNPAGSGKYIAPELLTPNATATPESDIYSLGVMAREIAEVTSDPQLREAALVCTDDDPGNRAEGLRMLKENRLPSPAVKAMDRILSSSRLTAVLITLCGVLAAFIAYHYATV
ncbi:MAG: protein kinase [Muribaculaceae bacterium]|nr:protein kinase [Muribaculaceae bacterium]